jgi:hypothetical protein
MYTQTHTHCVEHNACVQGFYTELIEAVALCHTSKNIIPKHRTRNDIYIYIYIYILYVRTQTQCAEQNACVQGFYAELIEAVALRHTSEDLGDFGLEITACRAPRASDFPQVRLKGRYAGSLAHEPLISVDGAKVAGMTAKQVKALVSNAGKKLTLCVLADDKVCLHIHVCVCGFITKALVSNDSRKLT